MSIAGLSPSGRYRFVSGLFAASSRKGLIVAAAIHLAALVVIYRTEWGLVHGLLALLAWGLLNFLWLTIVRRPAISAALSFTLLVLLLLLSLF